MNIHQKVAILESYPLFKDLIKEELQAFAEKAREKIFPPKTIILNQAEPSHAVYFMYKGLIRIYILNREGRIIPIRVKGPMYIIGEMNLFDDQSTASIETIQETHTLMCTKEECLKLVTEHPSVAFSLLKNLNEKLRAANRQTEYHLSLRLKERTWGILRTLAPHFPDNEISLSQEELALIIGASRARITEVLDELAAQKLITLSHRKIRLV